MRKHLVFAAALMLVLGGQAWMPATGSAITLFFDDFNSENGGNYQLNYDNFANWDVQGGTVDLIGLGSPWDWFAPEQGLYVDMDGSTGNAGLMTTEFTLEAGEYLLEFDLAGNHRVGTPEEVLVQIGLGSLIDESISLNRDDPFQTYALAFTVDSTMLAQLSFEGIGGDNIGMLLDNVRLSNDAAPVPEPATVFLLGGGLLGLARLRKKQQA